MFTTCLLTTIPILKQRGPLLLAVIKLLLDGQVAAAIARREQQFRAAAAATWKNHISPISRQRLGGETRSQTKG
jgi:hypothetical protein